MKEAATEEAQMRKPPANPTEQECPTCNGTGYRVVMQPLRPGRKIYPAPCKKYGGKGLRRPHFMKPLSSTSVMWLRTAKTPSAKAWHSACVL
jgi:hypothetical protein